jgi:transglutaminase-like putative cysteine protease
MARLRIRHITRYDYRNPVGLTPHRLMIRPRDSHDLRLHEATLSVSPTPRVTRWAHDVFGNSVCLIDWEPEARTDHLEIISELDLTHYPAGPEQPRATVDPTVETFPFSYAADEAPDLARLRERHLPDPQRRIDAWARRFLAQGGATRTLPMLEAMTRAIRDEFIYEARDAEGTNSPVETLESGKGACRDFTLLMMEAARSLGLAARFVSGYLYDAAGSGVVGGGATHAWCAIYVPWRRLGGIRSDQRAGGRREPDPRRRHAHAGTGGAGRWRVFRQARGLRPAARGCRRDGGHHGRCPAALRATRGTAGRRAVARPTAARHRRPC